MDEQENQGRQDRPQRVEWRGWKGLARPGLKLDPLFELIGHDPLKTIAENGKAEFVKAKIDKGSRVFRAELDLGAGPEELFIKTFDSAETARIMRQRLFTREGLRKPHHYPVKLIKMLYYPSLARRCWKTAGACRRAGIPVADHLLFISRGWGLRREEVLVTRGIRPRRMANARAYFESSFQPPNPPEKRALKRELLSELGRFLRKVHQSGIVFGDFKLHNLVLRELPGGGFSYVVVDLSEAGAGFLPWPEYVFLERFSPHLLRSPCFTAGDLVRLINAYLRAGDDKRQWREVCEGIRRRARKQGRAPG